MQAANCFAIIPAAGVGLRMGADKPKQYLMIGKKTILEHTITQLQSANLFEKIYVALAEGDRQGRDILSGLDNIEIVNGGQRRCDSVRNALMYLRDKVTLRTGIFVHDAVRPCVHVDDLVRLHAAFLKASIGVILAEPLTDTLKRCDAQKQVIETLPRADLWRAQTPQAFRFGVLWDAFSDEQTDFSDEASAVESLGLQPQVVQALHLNLKITTPIDLHIAQAYLTT